MTTSAVARVVLFAVAACWLASAAVFLLRRRPDRAAAETRRERGTAWGFVLQGVGFAAVWMPPMRRPFFTPFVEVPLALEILLGAAAVALAVFSVALVSAAVRTLGKQWALAARLVAGHELVREGPYRFVRNPIYFGMLGMLVATGVAMSRPWALAAGVASFLAGTRIRVAHEEKLLRSAFPDEFDAYARKVRAMLPGLW